MFYSTHDLIASFNSLSVRKTTQTQKQAAVQNEMKIRRIDELKNKIKALESENALNRNRISQIKTQLKIIKKLETLCLQRISHQNPKDKLIQVEDSSRLEKQLFENDSTLLDLQNLSLEKEGNDEERENSYRLQLEKLQAESYELKQQLGSLEQFTSLKSSELEKLLHSYYNSLKQRLELANFSSGDIDQLLSVLNNAKDLSEKWDSLVIIDEKLSKIELEKKIEQRNFRCSSEVVIKLPSLCAEKSAPCLPSNPIESVFILTKKRKNPEKSRQDTLGQQRLKTLQKSNTSTSFMSKKPKLSDQSQTQQSDLTTDTQQQPVISKSTFQSRQNKRKQPMPMRSPKRTQMNTNEPPLKRQHTYSETVTNPSPKSE